MSRIGMLSQAAGPVPFWFLSLPASCLHPPSISLTPTLSSHLPPPFPPCFIPFLLFSSSFCLPASFLPLPPLLVLQIEHRAFHLLGMRSSTGCTPSSHFFFLTLNLCGRMAQQITHPNNCRHFRHPKKPRMSMKGGLGPAGHSTSQRSSLYTGNSRNLAAKPAPCLCIKAGALWGRGVWS